MRHITLSFIALSLMTGCGATHAPGVAPTINSQPEDVVVPLGTGATFSVGIQGSSPITFQWQRNGIDISGSNTNIYNLQNTSAADAGTTFDVVVSNSAGSVKSRGALLSLGARSPAAGDLRFQQVDSALTINNYQGLSSGVLSGDGGYFASNAFGIPLSVGPSCYAPDGTPFGCGWIYGILVPATGSTSLKINYSSTQYIDGQTEVKALLQPNIVITGMDLEAGNQCSTFSYLTQDPALTPFTGQLITGVQLANLQTSAAAQTTVGRVITGISYSRTGEISYVAYARQGDTTQYDVQIATATVDTAAAAAQSLAASGYILTAIGGNEYVGVLLVGTRVHGDTLPRPIMVIQGGQTPTFLSESGYATVAVLYTPARGFINWIGER